MAPIKNVKMWLESMLPAAKVRNEGMGIRV